MASTGGNRRRSRAPSSERSSTLGKRKEACSRTTNATSSSKKPPGLRNLIVVAFIVLATIVINHSSLRWRLLDAPHMVAEILPSFLGGHSRQLPRVLRIENRLGVNSEVMSGEYVLLENYTHGRPSWAKRGGGQQAYILWDYCNSWLVSRYPSGNPPRCEGWSFASGCMGLPWTCGRKWHIREGEEWVRAGRKVVVTPLWEDPEPETSSEACSAEEEQQLLADAATLDVVIPWINGSDPAWISARQRTCEEWFWYEMWPDALARSASTQTCLLEEASVAEAKQLLAQDTCAAGASDPEGSCPDVTKSRDRSMRGLTTRTSICFRRFVQDHCVARTNTIGDHDELRYLVRSLERHLPWHQGRILLITSRNQTPAWLRPKGRLQVYAQEDLLQAALSSNWYVPSKRLSSSYAPHRIFNDYPVEAALPFLPGASRAIMLLQDDLLFARPTSVCDLFAGPPLGLRIFARPFEAVHAKDPWAGIYESMEWWSENVWRELADDIRSSDKRGAADPYYRTMHVPQMIDRETLEDLWRENPIIMSEVVASAFRHPNLTNAIALHHSTVARRSRLSGANPEEQQLGLVAGSRVENLASEDRGSLPLHRRPWLDVVFRSLEDWHEKVASIPPNTSALPAVLSLQDDLSAEVADILQLDCMRERWLTKLLPMASSYEDPAHAPSMCKRFEKGAAG